MVRRSAESASRRHVHLFNDDWDWLTAHFGPGSAPTPFGVSRAVRMIVNTYVKAQKARQQVALDTKDSTNVRQTAIASSVVELGSDASADKRTG